MKEVYQTKFGGIDAPIEERGNCWQAAVASVLELKLEDAFDIRQYDQGKEGSKWLEDFNEWLEKYNLGCVCIEVKRKELPSTLPLGYHIAEVTSTTLTKGETHIIVIHNYEPSHDPNPKAEGIGDLIAIYLFVALDPSKLVSK